jgi:hypothetical protein
MNMNHTWGVLVTGVARDAGRRLRWQAVGAHPPLLVLLLPHPLLPTKKSTAFCILSMSPRIDEDEAEEELRRRSSAKKRAHGRRRSCRVWFPGDADVSA